MVHNAIFMPQRKYLNAYQVSKLSVKEDKGQQWLKWCQHVRIARFKLQAKSKLDEIEPLLIIFSCCINWP